MYRIPKCYGIKITKKVIQNNSPNSTKMSPRSLKITLKSQHKRTVNIQKMIQNNHKDLNNRNGKIPILQQGSVMEAKTINTKD